MEIREEKANADLLPTATSEQQVVEVTNDTTDETEVVPVNSDYSSLGTPPSTATRARSPSMPQAKTESSHDLTAASEQILGENLLQPDEDLKNSADEEHARKVIRYIGRDRREALDKEIERLYEEVVQELNDYPEGVDTALHILRKAHDIILEDIRQYEEALYLAAMVKVMIARERNLRRRMYTWGAFIAFYGVVWLILFLGGYIFTDQLGKMVSSNNLALITVSAAWFAALAGGIGGVCAIFYSLYWHIFKRDFNPSFVFYYLLSPIMGFILGAAVYFISAAGFLFINLVGDPTGSQVLTSPTIIAIQISLGWFAGFRFRRFYEVIDKISLGAEPVLVEQALARFSKESDKEKSDSLEEIKPLESMQSTDPSELPAEQPASVAPEHTQQLETEDK